MKKGELLAVFLAVAVFSAIGYSLFRKQELFAVYDEKGNLISTQQA